MTLPNNVLGIVYTWLSFSEHTHLMWNTHTSAVSGTKSTGPLVFLSRNVSTCHENMEILAYKTIVLPHLEYYCDTVCDPHTYTNRRKLEPKQN